MLKHIWNYFNKKKVVTPEEPPHVIEVAQKISHQKRITINPKPYIKKSKSNPSTKAISKGKYQIQNDETSIDNFVKDIHAFFGEEIINTSVGGMSSVPPRIRNYKKFGKEHLRLNTDNTSNFYWMKNYYTRFTFNESNCRFLHIIQSLGTIEEYEDFHKDVIRPMGDKVEKYFKKNFPKYKNNLICSVGFSGQKITLIIRLSLPINATDVVCHCGTQNVTEYASNLKDEFIEICKEDLESDLNICFSIFGDYEYRENFFRKCENKLRKKHNVPEIGKGNISQYLLYSLLQKYFPNIKYEYSPRWLGNQRYDMFIPSKRTAIEYNGIQHYEPVEAWGGKEGLKKNKKRDADKARKSKENNIDLRIWHYSKSINEENVREFISDLI